MPLTYSWSQLFDLARVGFGKSVPTATADRLLLADMVSSEIWTAHPWYRAKTNIPAGTALVNGTQDYNAPANIMRLTKLSLVRTDTTPDEHRELSVRQEIDVDLRKRSPYSIQAGCLQAGLGLIRLESAAHISTDTWELAGEYQMNPTKITAITDQLWFDDHWLEVGVHGLLKWLYRQGGDDQNADKHTLLFMAGVERMWRAEDFGGVDGHFPGDAIGAGRDDYGFDIYG